MRDKQIIIALVIWLILSITILIYGCQSQQMPAWGEGDPPIEWQGHFGNDNISRLNFIQTDRLNKQGQAMAELSKRVRKLEDPND